jgi:hypothetical protein
MNASGGGNASQVAQKAKRAGRALFDDQFEPSAGGLVLGSVRAAGSNYGWFRLSLGSGLDNRPRLITTCTFNDIHNACKYNH